MRKILFMCLLCMGCAKDKVEPTEKALVYMAFRNFTSMEFNYDDGCEANVVPTGVRKFLTSGTDTICSFKVDEAGIVSWKTHPGHVVTLGGCNIRSLTITQ